MYLWEEHRYSLWNEGEYSPKKTWVFWFVTNLKSVEEGQNEH